MNSTLPALIPADTEKLSIAVSTSPAGSASTVGAVYELILLRHGRSQWNEKNLFTGWHDCPLAASGRDEARRAGALLAEAGLLPEAVHTSVLRRAIETAEIALAAAGRSWIPVRRSWRLNERHYGDLTGLDKAETAARHGAEQVRIWRRSYRIAPPPMAAGHRLDPAGDPAYAELAPELVPRAESLAAVTDRLLPYWHDAVAPDLRAGRIVLVSAHGNSLRGLVKHLDGIGEDEIAGVEIPTGLPLHYRLGEDLTPLEAVEPLERALGPGSGD